MAGQTHTGELKPADRMGPMRFRFDLAGPADEPEFRRLLRENPMGKVVKIGFHREPDASLSGTVEGPLLHQVIVARLAVEHEPPAGSMISPQVTELFKKGRLFASSTRSLRQVYINGVPTVAGYLGSLRVDYPARKSPRLVWRGFDFLRKLHEADLKKRAQAPASHPATRLYFTSILADNRAAIRLLESAITGMPVYRKLTDYTTLVIPVNTVQKVYTQHADKPAVERADEPTRSAIASLIHQTAKTRQFASVWREHDLDSPTMARGLKIQDYRLIIRDGQPAACCSLWDQRAYKQTVVQYAGGWLANVGMTAFSQTMNAVGAGINSAINSVINSPLNQSICTVNANTNLPPLPAPGMLEMATISHLATNPDSTINQQTLDAIALVSLLCRDAAEQGIDYLAVGANSADPVINALEKNFRNQKIKSHIYAVYWPDGQADVDALDACLPTSPDLGVL